MTVALWSLLPAAVVLAWWRVDRWLARKIAHLDAQLAAITAEPEA